MACLSPAPSRDEHLDPGLVSNTALKVFIDGNSSIAAVILALIFIITATRFRLWHSNILLEKFPQWMDGAVLYLINNIIVLIVAVNFRNDLYLVWIVLLSIAYDGVSTVLGYSLLKTTAERIKHEYTRVSNIVIIALFLAFYARSSIFWHALIALWSLVLLKSVRRIVSFIAAEQAYGMKNTDLIANYMTTENEMTSDVEIHPTSLKGYKYIVLGERNIEGETIRPDYVKKYQPPDGVVTVDMVYACEGILNSCDKDFLLRDVCLSFALFKLLKRRFFRYHAAESNLPKTRDLVFQGLLAEDKMERALRVVRTELGFLRDLLYTKYPIIFGRGFPIFSTLLFFGILGVSVWITDLAFHYRHTLPGESTLVVNNKNVDIYLTYVLILIIMLMEICEAFLCVFSDWSRVMLICKYVQSKGNQCFIIPIKLLAFISRPKFSKPLSDTLGQYSLLKNYNRRSFRRLGGNLLNKLSCGFSATEIERGFHSDPPIKFPEEVKGVIFLSLQTMKEQLGYGSQLTNRKHYSLQRNGMIHLSWACDLRPHTHTISHIHAISRMHIIMVWHIATSLCDIHQSSRPLNKIEDMANHKAAVSLSRYCAYLALFVPELLLPFRCNAEKYVLAEIVLETRSFFEGDNSPEQMLKRMEKAQDGVEKIVEMTGEKIVEKGALLGRQLTSDPEAPNDQLRWKVLAEFWAELLVFLAPSGIASAHAEKLAEGGEFITQLWALLYHAGINEQVLDPFGADGNSSSIQFFDPCDADGNSSSIV